MRILIIASYYPHSHNPLSGTFIEKCVLALKELCDYVEVLVPRPYVPPFLSLRPRWKIYSKISDYEIRNGINVHRPPNFQIPRLGNAFWSDYGAYLCCRRLSRRLQRKAKFDVIISFDLLGAGGLAWRIGKNLGIPSCGWAFGTDVRVGASSSLGRVVIRAIKNLDLIFYQSFELLNEASKLVDKKPEEMLTEKNIVLSHGITIPPLQSREEMRKDMRARWGISNNEIVILSLGRITREKGINELLDAVSYVTSLNKDIICILIGSVPAFDESAIVEKMTSNNPVLKDRIRTFPACNHNEIWDVFCGADIFAFTSHHEGMPNSLLEAMASGLPAIAFAISPVEELDARTDSLIKIPPFNSKLFAEAILELSESKENRNIIGEKGKKHVMEHFQMNKNMARAVEKICKVINK